MTLIHNLEGEGRRPVEPPLAGAGQRNPTGSGGDCTHWASACGDPSAVHWWLGTARRLLTEAGKFGVIGTVNAFVDIGLFNALYAAAHVEPLTAKLVSAAVTAVSSYYANRAWTWPHRAGRRRSRDLAHYLVICVVGLVPAQLCLLISHYALGYHTVLADNVSANGVGLVLGTVWRFTAARRWVFTATRARPVGGSGLPLPALSTVHPGGLVTCRPSRGSVDDRVEQQGVQCAK